MLAAARRKRASLFAAKPAAGFCRLLGMSCGASQGVKGEGLIRPDFSDVAAEIDPVAGRSSPRPIENPPGWTRC